MEVELRIKRGERQGENVHRKHHRGSQRLFDFYRSAAGLHVDPPAAACLSLKGHIDEIGAAKVQRRIKNELPHVRLDVGFCPAW
jgi:hypothetical protein